MTRVVKLAVAYARITTEKEGLWDVDVKTILGGDTSVTLVSPQITHRKCSLVGRLRSCSVLGKIRRDVRNGEDSLGRHVPMTSGNWNGRNVVE